MWEYEHSVDTSATPEAIWRLWSDVQTWTTWNADIADVHLNGAFATGGEIVMTPAGQDPVHLRLTDVVEAEAFVDEAVLGDVTVRTEHRLQPLDDKRLRVVYRMQITGPQADRVGPELGPAISADFPQTMAALVALAER